MHNFDFFQRTKTLTWPPPHPYGWPERQGRDQRLPPPASSLVEGGVRVCAGKLLAGETAEDYGFSSSRPGARPILRACSYVISSVPGVSPAPDEWAPAAVAQKSSTSCVSNPPCPPNKASNSFDGGSSTGLGAGGAAGAAFCAAGGGATGPVFNGGATGNSRTG